MTYFRRRRKKEEEEEEEKEEAVMAYVVKGCHLENEHVFSVGNLSSI